MVTPLSVELLTIPGYDKCALRFDATDTEYCECDTQIISDTGDYENDRGPESSTLHADCSQSTKCC